MSANLKLYIHEPVGYSTKPRGSHPTPFLGYLVLWLGSVILQSRRPKKGVGYESPGIMDPWGFKVETLAIPGPKPSTLLRFAVFGSSTEVSL